MGTRYKRNNKVLLHCNTTSDAILFSLAHHSNSGLGGLILEVCRQHTIRYTHTHTHTYLLGPPEQVISSPQRQQPTQQVNWTNIHTLSGIWTHNRSKPSGRRLRLRQHGSRNRLWCYWRDQILQVWQRRRAQRNGKCISIDGESLLWET